MVELRSQLLVQRNKARGVNIQAAQLRRYRIAPDTDCWLFTGQLGTDGYGKLKRGGRTVRAHRVFYEHYVGAIPAGLLVCHRCDNPRCVNPAHLFCGTVLDNERDKDAKHRRPLAWFVLHPELRPRGESNAQSKLTAKAVALIRNTVGNTTQLAKRFGVCRTTIQRARSGRNWKGKI